MCERSLAARGVNRFSPVSREAHSRAGTPCRDEEEIRRKKKNRKKEAERGAAKLARKRHAEAKRQKEAAKWLHEQGIAAL